MRRHFVSLAVIVAIAVGWYLWRQRALEQAALPVHAAGSASAAGSDVGSASPAPGAGSGSGAKRAHVRRVTPEDRQKLAAQIQAAQTARAAARAQAGSGSGAAEAPGDDHLHDLDREPTAELDALQESVPFLAECYEKQGSGRPAGSTASAALTLTNDPDIGAVIDPGEITDGSGAALPKELDACLRTTILTLQLPPLAAGDTAKVVYSFKFDGAR